MTDIPLLSSSFSNIILLCRPGFDPECAQEMLYRAKEFGDGVVLHAQNASGYVVYHFTHAQSAQNCIRSLKLSSLIFCRQFFAASDVIGHMTAGNRVEPIAEVVRSCGHHFLDFVIETPDTNEAKELSGLCKKLEAPLSQAIRTQLHPDSKDRNCKQLHVFFTATDTAYAGYAFVNNSSLWHMGIPRLRFPSLAPSRSTLKLEEAFHVFLTADEQKKMFRAGMTAVDLGASPGGWTWQFVNKHIRVIAVDNGPMDKKLLESGMVQHVRGDGFTYAPKRPVDWMVCDIVEQPSRIAKLMTQWMCKKWCRYTIFNLKLPMKKRYDEIDKCKKLIDSEMKRAGIEYSISIKQLYHDREEVTICMQRL